VFATPMLNLFMALGESVVAHPGADQ